MKKRSAGAASGGFVWETPGAVIEVPDEVGMDLVERPGGEFTEAPAPQKPAKSPPQEARDEKATKEVTETTPGGAKVTATATAATPPQKPTGK